MGGSRGWNKFFASCKEDLSFLDFFLQTLSVDASNPVYRFVIAIRKKGRDMENKNGDMTSHLYAIFNYSIFLIRHGIKPFFVFDGPAPLEKKPTINKRAKTRDDAIDKCFECVDKDSDAYVKNFKKSFVLKRSHNLDCQELLRAMGIPFIQALKEADPQCAVIACMDDVYGSVGEDADLSIFGSPVQLKNFSGKNTNVQKVSMHKMLNYMNIKADEIRRQNDMKVWGCVSPNGTWIPNNVDIEKTSDNNDLPNKPRQIIHSNLIDFAILLGCDYTEIHIKGVSSEDIFKMLVLSDMNVPKTINLLNDHMNKLQASGEPYYPIPDTFVSEWRTAKNIYLNSKIIDPSTINRQISKPNRELIMDIMCTRNNFNKKMVEKIITELETMYEVFTSKDVNIALKKFQNYQTRHSKYNRHCIELYN
jgi:5'-3' exonuclease